MLKYQVCYEQVKIMKSKIVVLARTCEKSVPSLNQQIIHKINESIHQSINQSSICNSHISANPHPQPPYQASLGLIGNSLHVTGACLSQVLANTTIFEFMFSTR